MTRETNTHHQQYNLNEKLTKIKELFQQKSPDNWYIDDDISSWFDHDTVNNEKPIEFTPSVETLGKTTTEREMLSHERSVKLPLLQALDHVIELVGNDNVPADGHGTLIFLSTERKTGTACKLDLWRNSDGELKLNVGEVFPDVVWGAVRRVLRKMNSKTETLNTLEHFDSLEGAIDYITSKGFKITLEK